jgi:survival-of-motor-neuron-related-splicing factor 30
MEAELEAYEYQLSQVKLSLEADPGNVELTTLKGELEEIIDLTKQALGVSGTKAAGVAEGSSKGKGKSKEKGFKAGDEVSARYKDMKWYVPRKDGDDYYFSAVGSTRGIS